MKQEVKSILKKTAKIAGVTCIAAGAIAVLTSGAALTAMVAGGKYLVNTVKQTIKDNGASAENDLVAEAHFAAEDNEKEI